MHSMPYIAIIDFGSQTTMLIARRIRELGVLAKVLPATIGLEHIKSTLPWGIILSGGPASVYEEGCPNIDPRILDLGMPVLGICYGMQLLASHLGGKVLNTPYKEFGKHTIEIDPHCALFNGIDKNISVWMSHSDQVASITSGKVIAKSISCPFAAIEWDEKKLYGLQFHPEVFHTPSGKDILANFIFTIAKAQKNFVLENFITKNINEIKNQVKDEHVIMALSGGVDSSVAAVLIHKAIGKNLHGIFVDHGLHREDEVNDIYDNLKNLLGIDLIMVDASAQFLDALQGILDPEVKRKIIGQIFIDVFEKEASRWPKAKFLAQGTLYPDVIESMSPQKPIKTHHNVGGLPIKLKWDLIEPLRELFKDEVRNLGLMLDLPPSIIFRQPFPGPGLAVRIAGQVTTERIDIVRKADAVVRQEINKAKKEEKLPVDLWQWFAILLPVKSVGVMGDARVCGDTIVLRCVQSQDAMTADFCHVPFLILEKISSRITNEVPGVTRVLYDITQKPPGTIEWE
jgi:GMP synthase (glutamine-hydrolysing)